MYIGPKFIDKVQSRYQIQTWGSKRTPEYRITRNLKSLLSQASFGDELKFERRLDESNTYRITLNIKGTSEHGLNHIAESYLWIEMARDPVHGAGSWEFTKCLWSPTIKKGIRGENWPYWNSLLRVRAGDAVLHLRGMGGKAEFVGFSTAETDGFETTEAPPVLGIWNYAKKFYRVNLKDYRPFNVPIKLRQLFKEKDSEFRHYFIENKGLPKISRKQIFFVVQGGKLQCLNGAYLSEADSDLQHIIFGAQISKSPTTSGRVADHVPTSEAMRDLTSRIGQAVFSEMVRANYNSSCCFPDCAVIERAFLVGAHIARWNDEPSLRGEISNGLCLCLLHDKAFEQGLFTLALDHTVVINEKHRIFSEGPWCRQCLIPFKGQKIKLGKIKPSEQALRLHWERIGFRPDGQA
jgi:putative restriction endonuclease